jgi:ABC-type phosphate/phosphonate transport system substrate-binding protein
MKSKITTFFCIIPLIFTVNTSLLPQDVKQNQYSKSYTIGYMKNIFYNLDVNDVQASLKIWVDETQKLYKSSKDYHLINKVYENFDEFNSGIDKDNIAVMSLSTYDYLNFSNKVELEPILVPEIDGEVGTEYCLLVRKEDHYNNLKDLKGKKIGMISTPVFIASSLWLDVILSKNNFLPKTMFFNKIEEAQKESQLVLSLFFGNLDACIVLKSAFGLMKELNPQIGEKLVSIINSPKYISGLLCSPKFNQNKEVKQAFYDSLIKLHQLTVGRQIFTLLKIGKLVPFRDEYLNNFRNLLKDHKKIISNAK